MDLWMSFSASQDDPSLLDSVCCLSVLLTKKQIKKVKSSHDFKKIIDYINISIKKELILSLIDTNSDVVILVNDSNPLLNMTQAKKEQTDADLDTEAVIGTMVENYNENLREWKESGTTDMDVVKVVSGNLFLTLDYLFKTMSTHDREKREILLSAAQNDHLVSKMIHEEDFELLRIFQLDDFRIMSDIAH